MKLGLILPIYIYHPKRWALVENTCRSLLRSKAKPGTKLLVVERKTSYECKDFSSVFDYEYVEDPPGIDGPDTPLCWGSERLFSQGVDYTVWLNDDGVFHPDWLIQLENLIERHPGAKAWSVYHSASPTHKEIETVGEDVKVGSVCGHGQTLSRKEFKEWGVNSSSNKDWTSPFGCTIDLHHMWQRPGDRWVTSKSYMQHTGTMIGLHFTGTSAEYAKDFVEEEIGA